MPMQQQYSFKINFSRLFDDEKEDLFTDLRSLPEYAELRKLNDLSKRARLAKVL